jgi:nitroreductase
VKRLVLLALVLGGCLTRPALAGPAEDLEALPAPRTTGGKPLLQALAERQTRREFKSDPLTPGQLSDLLWAAFGVNRPASGRRTAPSAKNAQEIDLYVVRADGAFLFEPGPHRLRRVAAGDLRRLTGDQDFAVAAPVTLVLVADLAKFSDTPDAAARMYAAFDAGCISQNVYLFAASEGLATVVHDLNREPLARALNLRDGQHIILAQAVGWPR